MGFMYPPKYFLQFPIDSGLKDDNPNHRLIMASPGCLITSHRTYCTVKNSNNGLFTAIQSASAFYRDFRSYRGSKEEKHFLQLRLFHLGVYQDTYLFYLFHIVNDHLTDEGFSWSEFRGDANNFFLALHPR